MTDESVADIVAALEFIGENIGGAVATGLILIAAAIVIHGFLT